MVGEPAPTSIDGYLARFDPETRSVLQEVRAVIQNAAPEATESISYGIPTFDLAGRHLIHFGGYQKHIGIYPVTAATAEALGERLKTFKRGKGSLRLPLGETLPIDLLRRIVKLRILEVTTGMPGGSGE